MDIQQLTEFFKWMTVINIGIMIFSTFMIMALKKLICKMHGKMFGVKEEAVAAMCYGYLGVLKIFVIVFNLTPYIALVVIG